MYTFDQVAAVQDSFLEPVDAVFSIREIPVASIRTAEGSPAFMDDAEIAGENDTEYIAEMVEAAKMRGLDAFTPVVVLDRGDHYEWQDGAHRITALHRAGYGTVRAYVGVTKNP